VSDSKNIHESNKSTQEASASQQAKPNQTPAFTSLRSQDIDVSNADTQHSGAYFLTAHSNLKRKKKIQAFERDLE